MRLAKYISDLLYRYECVIIPDFGGFITQEISATINHFTHTFSAPSKQIGFNAQLKNSDGLLINYVATSEAMPFDQAATLIANEVAEWKVLLKSDTLELEGIGSISQSKEGMYIFEPSNEVNYLTSSFGLTSYISPAISRIKYKEQVKSLKPEAPLVISERKRSKSFIKYAASAAIIFALGTLGWNEHQKSVHNELLAAAETKQEQVEKKIQEATFEIENPLPTITVNIVKETYDYHVIAGAFREPGNAEKKVNQLKAIGFDAKILGINKWNLTQVAYASFNSRAEALTSLRKIQKTDSKDAWLLVKRY